MQVFSYFSSQIIPKKRRGISQVIGSLLLLAIVVPIGTVILVNGSHEINSFNNELSNTVTLSNNGAQEDLIFEHIRFNPPTGEVTLSIRNTGTIDATVDRITLVNMTNQDILYKIDGMSIFVPIIINVQTSADIVIDATPEGGSWDSSFNLEKDYKVSIISSRGNFFDTVARPYNT